MYIQISFFAAHSYIVRVNVTYTKRNTLICTMSIYTNQQCINKHVVDVHI